MRIDRFELLNGTIYTFPKYDVTDRLGQVDAAVDFLVTPRGGFDPLGDDDALDRPATLTKSFTLRAPTDVALQAALDAVRGLRGRAGWLWGRTYTNEVRRLRARVAQIEVDRTNRNWNSQPVTVIFEAGNQAWQGRNHRAWTLDSGEKLDNGLHFDDPGATFTLATSNTNCVVTNGGNRPVTDVRLTFIAGSTALTSLVIGCGSAQLTWSGTLNSGQTLVIDCGAMSVLLQGVAAYNQLGFGVGHQIEEWLRLEPGANTIAVTRTGGANSTLVVSYRDGWK